MTRVIRFLLLAYPPSIRRAHGAEMAAAVESKWQECGGFAARVRFVIDLIGDFLASWPREWRDAAGRSPRGRRAGSGWTVTSDIRGAIRLFTREPLFTAGAVATLALGIGATSAIFSLADATLLRPLPIRQPEAVWQVDSSWTHPDFRDLSAGRGETMSEVVAWSDQTFGFDRGGEVVELAGAAVSGGYFGLTGLSPVLGRLLNDADDTAGAPPVVVLSERAWSRLFQRDPAVVGRTVQLNRRPVTIAGIAPRSFRGLSLRDAPELFIPLNAMPKVATGFLSRPGIMSSRDFSWLHVAVRLREGISPARAEAVIDGIYRGIHPPKTPAAKADEFKLGAINRHALGLDTSDDPKRFVLVLTGATSITLLLACATVANLLLLRSERRRRELAVRSALGASRARVMRLLLAESLAIGLAGGFGGLMAARGALAVLSSFELPGRVLIQDLGLSLSPALLAMAVALGLVTSLVFGLAPAWQASRFEAQASLRDGARGSTRQPIRSALVAIQVALCVLLLAGAIAFGRAMQHALSIDMGFDTSSTSIASINPGRARYNRAQTAEARTRIHEAVTAQPWVTAAGWSSILPLRGLMVWTLGIPSEKDSVTEEGNVVSLGYFDAMNIPIRLGRVFAPGDTAAAPKVLVVSESMAKKYWPAGDAIGARVNTNTDSKDPKDIATVVGVVGDVKHDLGKPRDRMFYAASAQHLSMIDFGGQNLIVRATVPPDVAVRNVAAVIRGVDPMLPISRSQTMAEHLGALLMPQRLGLTLFLLFAGLAVLLTTFGIYAVVAFAVAQRSREIGIRVALGAERRSVLALVVRQGARPIVAGLVAGLAAIAFFGSALKQFLLELPPASAVSLAVVLLGVGALGVIAMIVPARRALGVDPAIALRRD